MRIHLPKHGLLLRFPLEANSVVGLILVVAGVGVGVGGAQTPAQPAFEVVSIKPNTSGDERSSSIVMPGAVYRATNVTLRMLIKTAYQVHDDQIVGGPGWMNTERFDVSAKGAGSPTTTEFVTQARLMLRPALADRFQVSIRREQQELPIYALVHVRDDRRIGPQLNRTDLRTCDGPPMLVPVAEGAAEPSERLPCEAAFARPNHLSARGRDFGTLITQVSVWADHVTIDGTGLTGKYDWDLQWTPEPLGTDPAPASAVSLTTALREQLGLKLEARRGAVDVLVITRAERPSAN